MLAQSDVGAATAGGPMLSGHANAVATFVAAQTRWGALALAIGFLCFGFAIGGLTGFSSAQGVSLTLLSSLFTFVSGVVLTFTGFRRMASSDSALDPGRVGAGLAALSLGIVLGVLLGVYGRCNVRVQSVLLGEAVAHSQCMSSAMLMAPDQAGAQQGGAGLMAKQTEVCQQAAVDLEFALREGTSGQPALIALMSKLNRACKFSPQ